MQHFSESYRQQIAEQAALFTKPELKDFQKKVNAAATELCLKDLSLLKRRGELLQMARKKVADDGYIFKKGHSRSKVYGQSDVASAPKRPKYDKEAREERIGAIDEELSDISRLLAYKEKSLCQAESARNYKLCEKVTEELMALKSKRRDLSVEKRLFEQKRKRARRREVRIRKNSESSDIDTGPASGRSSRSVTPQFHGHSRSSLSGTSAHDDPKQVTSPKSPQALSSSHGSATSCKYSDVDTDPASGRSCRSVTPQLRGNSHSLASSPSITMLMFQNK